MRVLTLKRGKMHILTLKKNKQRNLDRLRKWCGFEYDFAGGFTSPRWNGYKTYDRAGNLTYHIWENK